MVVDDEVKILDIVREMLEKEGYEVIVADSGEMCLEILKDEKPDLILMDVMMPDMDGWETVERIKKDEANRDIIISMLTVKAREIDKAKSLDEVGADWHIPKPVTKEKLLETVHWLLTKK
jgi:CheY-like chemotaxis protein